MTASRRLHLGAFMHRLVALPRRLARRQFQLSTSQRQGHHGPHRYRRLGRHVFQAAGIALPPNLHERAA